MEGSKQVESSFLWSQFVTSNLLRSHFVTLERYAISDGLVLRLYKTLNSAGTFVSLQQHTYPASRQISALRVSFFFLYR